MCTYGPLFGISKIKFKFETSKIDVPSGYHGLKLTGKFFVDNFKTNYIFGVVIGSSL